MGRTRKYRNDADKQKAYRQRKNAENWSDELVLKVAALRKTVQFIAQETPHTPSVEVYRCMNGTYTYKLLKFVWHWMTIDLETFEAIKPELTLQSKTRDTEIYRFQ